MLLYKHQESIGSEPMGGGLVGMRGMSHPDAMLIAVRRTNVATERAVAAVFDRQGDLITRSQALAVGLTKEALRRRLRESGPWKIVLPGIYLRHNGELTVGQRELAAVLYAGRESVITGPAALRRAGVRAPRSDDVDVLIPAARRRLSTSFVIIHRTFRMPERPWRMDGLRWAPPPRALADAARGEIEPREVRALVATAVQQGKCTIEQLAAELRAGPSQGSSSLRAALDDVIVGIASVAEGDLRRLIKAGGLPEPLWNPRLFVDGLFLASPDAWWPDAGVACEVDSRQWHLSPEDWARTQARHAKMSAHGILVLHYAPRTITSEPDRVVEEIASTLVAGRGRPPLAIRTVRSR